MSGQNNNRRRTCANLSLEMLEFRVVPAAGIGFDSASRVLYIIGSNGNDSTEVRQQGNNIIVSLNSGSGRLSRTMRSATVSRIVFTGGAGNDSFTNLTAKPVRADGGAGDDVLRGGSANDTLLGGDGHDRLFGGTGNDKINGGEGNDAAWGGIGNDQISGGVGNDNVYGDAGTDSLSGGDGNDQLSGGAGNDALEGEKGNDWFDGGVGNDNINGGEDLDREVDIGDSFADGDTDGDGFDNDHDYMDILYEVPGNPRAYADDTSATAAPIIANVADKVREFLKITAADSGLRVRVQINGGTVTEPGRWGDRVTGVWRYLTPDKIQVWGKWSYPASDPSQVNLAVQWRYNGPYSRDFADYANPAYYSISEESRILANYLNGAHTFINWLPGKSAEFYYSAPDEQATGFQAPIEALNTALSSFPNFTNRGNSFSGDFSTSPGLPGVQPVLDLLRTINKITLDAR